MERKRDLAIQFSKAAAFHQHCQHEQYSENRQRCIEALHTIAHSIHIFFDSNALSRHYLEMMCDLCSEQCESLELVFDMLECAIVLIEIKRIQDFELNSSEVSILNWYHTSGKTDLGKNNQLHKILPIISEQLRMQQEISSLRNAMNCLMGISLETDNKSLS